jgi:hypothetical protein
MMEATISNELPTCCRLVLVVNDPAAVQRLFGRGPGSVVTRSQEYQVFDKVHKNINTGMLWHQHHLCLLQGHALQGMVTSLCLAVWPLSDLDLPSIFTQHHVIDQ